ncbi:MAG TPA: M48 family metallopeptidase [Ilumatobacteraceae bacterium]|nr:M48 family metallopeptidase [Ilumatobacteraceae bacterium]
MSSAFRGHPPSWQIEVVRSARRKRSVGARLVGEVLTVTVPSWMSAAEVDRHVADMVQRFARKHSSDHIDLAQRARQLARRFDLPTPTSISWVSNMRHRWGSCTYQTGTIRISDRMAGFPTWVLDAVIVHELAHLVVHGHGPAFDALASRYPLAERATGYLIAKSEHGDHPGSDVWDDVPESDGESPDEL